MPLESATTDVADHAYLYGDGLFEGIRIYNRRIFKLDEHLDRLFHGAKYLGFEQMPSFEFVRQTVLDVCKQADLSDGYIRINLTRGTGLGLDPSHIDRKPNLMVMVSTLRLYDQAKYEAGLVVVTTSYRMSSPNTRDPRLKCIGGYATNIMAKQQANAMGAGEGLMLNDQGLVAECTGDNIFLVKGNVIRTPHPATGILKGITRDTVINIARDIGYTVIEDFLTPFDIFASDECFLTGTAAEVIPMVVLDNRPLGDGTPGRVTKELMARYQEETKSGIPFD
jgi:branched-chain amino acid aminotransferase